MANSLTGEASPTSSTNETLSPTFTPSPTPPSPFLSTPHMLQPGYQLSPSPPGYPGPGPSSALTATPPPSGPPSKKAKIDHFETRLMIQKLTKLQNQNSKFKKNLFNPIAEKKRKINFAKQINNFIKRKSSTVLGAVAGVVPWLVPYLVHDNTPLVEPAGWCFTWYFTWCSIGVVSGRVPGVVLLLRVKIYFQNKFNQKFQ